MRRSLLWIVLGTVGLCCAKKEAPLAALPFADDFNRADFGAHWQGDPGWRIQDGKAFSAGTANRPLWLQARLPQDAIIEFEVRSDSPSGDIKFEMYGDGVNHQSGYIFIFGGWKNTISCIARLDEHGSDRQERKDRKPVKMGQNYQMKIVRQGKTIQWYIDGKLWLDHFDSEPLAGKGHDRFAFSNWQSNLYFDNLRIKPAGET